MLTTQAKIAEQIVLRLNQDNSDSSVDDREIMLSVHQVIAVWIRNQLYRTKGDEAQEVDGAFYYTIDDVPVLKNRKGKYYAVMPSTSVSLAFGVDIKRVGTDNGIGFVPVQNGFNDLFAGLASSSLEGQIGYFKAGANLEFANMTGSNNPKTVNIEMLIPFDSLDEDDQINIPADVLSDVMDNVYEKYSQSLKKPLDEVNNNIEN
tara:strand:+ start:4747 stop:5361 length:615 start_codon:yes stop_codon:yes gene_type:complete